MTAPQLEQRPLGQDGPLVDVIAVGTWAIGGTQWGPSDDDQSVRALQAALDAGFTLIDTADTYGEGRSEECVGRAIQGRRQEVFLSTKVGVLGNPTVGWKIDNSARHIREGCEASLKRLKTDTIDLFQLHWPVKDIPIEESLQALLALKEQGKVRHIGISNFHAPELEAAVQHGKLASLQSPLSMLERGVLEDDLPAASRNGLGFLAYSPLARGLLTGKFRGEAPTFAESDVRAHDPRFQGDAWQRNQRLLDGLTPIAEKHGRTLGQLAINWVLCQPGVTAALVGVRHAAQAQEALGGQGWRLDEGDLAQIGVLLA
ncbi:MAG TPA: aldo/keto reductase [Armatimonadota bacterium]|jgi:aryl-alcohol dehydrogenase-like predicted oxidoreductase